MGGIPFSILLSYILAHGEFFGNIGKAYPCVKGKQMLEFPESPVNTVVPERHSRKRWGTPEDEQEGEKPTIVGEVCP
jgi:hypothetical protein